MLFPTRMFGRGADIQLGRQYDVTADGRFLINTLLNEAAAPITLVQNGDETSHADFERSTPSVGSWETRTGIPIEICT